MTDPVSPPPNPKPPIIDYVTNRVTMIGGLIAAVVTVNTSVTSCSVDNIKRHDDFRAAVLAEEKYWKSLYDDYLATFDETIKDTQRDAKRQALRALANHSVPNFEEHRLGFFSDNKNIQKEATKNIVSIKVSLVDALLDEGANGSSPASTAALSAAKDAVFAAEEQSKARKRSSDDTVTPDAQAETVTQAEVRPTIATSVLSYQAQTFTAGSDKGWDYDIFWCAGSNERQNFTQAATIAQILAARAGTGQTLSGGSRVGRVRARALPESRQYSGSGYPSSGYLIRSEAGVERTVAKALLTLLTAEQQQPFAIDPIKMRTPYYISLFVCGVRGGGSPPKLQSSQ
jgi:hypothetical protein